MMDELKSCPFCGNTAMIIRDLDLQISGIHCCECKAYVKWPIEMKARETYGENMKRWTDKWNRRAE